MINLAQYGFQVEARSPSSEKPGPIKALENFCKSLGFKTEYRCEGDVAKANDETHMPVLKVTIKVGDKFRVFSDGKEAHLQHECMDHRRDQMCSCIYSLAKDSYENLTKVRAALKNLSGLEDKIKLCGFDAVFFRTYSLTRNYEFQYQAHGQEFPLVARFSVNSTNAAVQFGTGRDSMFGTRFEAISVSLGEYLNSNLISDDFVKASKGRVSQIRQELAKPLKELEFLERLGS
jgi:hypothetical protein